jgi:hypothetical protein
MADSIASTSYAGHGELQNTEEGRQADIDGPSSRQVFSFLNLLCFFFIIGTLA